MHPVSPFLFLAFCVPVMAATPRPVDSSRYDGLWKASPFTSPKAVVPKPLDTNPFEGYSLLGVSNIGDDRFRVTLVEKNSPDARIQVDSGSASKRGFRIIQVNPRDGQPLATTVVMAIGSQTGTVRFDERFLAPAQVQRDAPKEAAPNPPAIRPPRSRVMAPGSKTTPTEVNPGH